SSRLSGRAARAPTFEGRCPVPGGRPAGGAADTMIASCGTLTQARVFGTASASTAVNANWTQMISEVGMGRTSLAVAPSNDLYVYALSADSGAAPAGGYLHSVKRSTD